MSCSGAVGGGRAGSCSSFLGTSAVRRRRLNQVQQGIVQVKCRWVALNKQVSSKMSSWRDGDWMCVRPHCGGINFASRTKCRDCGLAKPTEFQPVNGRSKPSPQRRIGDWDCTCGFVNFGSRVACHSCGKSRTSEEETSTSNECVICMDAQRDVLLATCRHLSMCTTCVQSVRECPICRATFDETDIIPVFIS